jgi:hypothetical protein
MLALDEVGRYMAEFGERLAALTARVAAHEEYEETRWKANDKRWDTNDAFLKEFREERRASVTALHARVDEVGKDMKQAIQKALVSVITALLGAMGLMGGALAWMATHYMLK